MVYSTERTTRRRVRQCLAQGVSWAPAGMDGLGFEGVVFAGKEHEKAACWYRSQFEGLTRSQRRKILNPTALICRELFDVVMFVDNEPEVKDITPVLKAAKK